MTVKTLAKTSFAVQRRKPEECAGSCFGKRESGLTIEYRGAACQDC
jgi:hypothetical protein